MDANYIQTVGNGLLDTAKVDVHKLQDQLQSHHINLSWFRLAEIALFLGLVFGVYMHSAKVEAANMAKFEVMQSQYKADSDKLREDLKASYESRIQEANKQAALATQMTARNAKADKGIQDAKKPDATLTEVATAAHEQLGVTPAIEPDNKLGFDKGEVQDFIATDIDRDRLSQNLTDTTAQFESSKKNEVSLTTDLAATKKVGEECKTSLDQLKTVKTPNKFKAALIKVGLFVAGAWLGHQIP